MGSFPKCAFELSVVVDMGTLRFKEAGFKCSGGSLDDDDNVPILRLTQSTFIVITY